MAFGDILGGLVGGIGSFLGGKEQSDAIDDAAKRQVNALKAAANQLNADFDDILADIAERPTDFAGTKVQGAGFEPINLAASQAEAISANSVNLDDILNLSGNTNRATIQNDLRRVSKLFPDFDRTLGNLSSAAASLSGGQLPFDKIEDIVSQRSGTAAVNVPGGSGPATLRDLGLSSLDAINQGQSLFQSILQAADQFVSPISRQTAAPQFFTSPQEATQLGLTQAQLDQQSRQNINNLDAQPNPADNLNMQLRIQQATGRAGTQAQIAGLGQPVVPSTLGLASQTLAQPIGNAIGSLFGNNQQTGFQQGFGSFGGGFNPLAHNAQAQYYNTFGPGSNPGTPPKAIVVT